METNPIENGNETPICLRMRIDSINELEGKYKQLYVRVFVNEDFVFQSNSLKPKKIQNSSKRTVTWNEHFAAGFKDSETYNSAKVKIEVWGY